MLTAIGFVLQFLGLRACHSSVSVFQLGVTLVMSTVRSALRTERLKKEDNLLVDRPDSYQGHELDWLALKLEATGLTDGQRKVSSSEGSQDTKTMAKSKEKALLSAGKDQIVGFSKDDTDAEGWRTDTQRDSGNSDRPHDLARVFLYRRRFADLAQSWDNKHVAVRGVVRSLTRAIEATADILSTTDVVLEKGWEKAFILQWAIPCTQNRNTEQPGLPFFKSPHRFGCQGEVASCSV